MPATSDEDDAALEDDAAADEMFPATTDVRPAGESSAGDGVSSPASRRRVPVLSAPMRADADDAADDAADDEDEEEEEDEAEEDEAERWAAAWRNRARSGKKSRSTICSSTAV